MDALMVSKFVAVPSSIFLGSYNFVFSQNAIPYLYNLPATTSTPIFAKVFDLGAKTIAPISVGAVIGYGYLAYTTPSKRTVYTSSAALTIGTLVLTLTTMKPGINRLIEISKTGATSAAIDNEARQLLKAWVGQNYFRSSLHLVAGLMGMYAVLN